MQTNQWINSKVYPALLKKGSDNGVNPYTLIGIYATLLHKRNASHCYKTIKNKSNGKITKGYRLLARESGFSLTALKKYVPLLIEEGLCGFTINGGFFMVGANKINKIYKTNKKVCIKVGGSLTDLKTSVMSVCVITNILQSQPYMIEKKSTLSKTKMAIDKSFNVPARQIKKLKEANKVNFDFSSVQKNTVLSVKGVANVLESDLNCSFSGQYWKKKLVEGDYLLFRRRFKSLWSKTMTYEEFLSHKPYFEKEYGHVTYKNGRISKEVVSEVMVKNNYSQKFNNDGSPILPYNSIIINNIYINKKKGLCVDSLLSCP